MLALLNVIDSSTKGFLEILSDVLVAQGGLSFTYWGGGGGGQASHVVALH